jgi:hypothetical protein
MAGEIRPIFSNEAQSQVDSISNSLTAIVAQVNELNKKQINFVKQGAASVKEVATATKDLEAIEKEQIKTKNALEVSSAKLVVAQSKQGKELIQVRSEIAAVNKASRDTIKENKIQENTWESLKNQIKKAEKEYRDLAVSQGLGSEQTKIAQKRLNGLKDTFNEVNKGAGIFNDQVGNYPKNIGAAIPGFDALSGVLENIGVNVSDISANNSGIKGSFATLKNGIMSATKAGIAFIATPVGAVIASLVAIAFAAKAFIDFNIAAAKTNLLVRQLANTSGEATDRLREQATAVTKAFDKDFKETVKELSDLQKDFGESSEKTFDIYIDGLVRGGGASQEFGDSIREYGSLFAKNGFSAQEFLNILNVGIDLGIYNDKLPDAIKEAGLALEEQTQTTKDALLNAFGAEFTDRILSEVDNGTKSVKEGLQAIAAESDKTALTQQQLAQLTTDVFKGAGEDAGGALVVFDAINKSLNLQAEGYEALEEGLSNNAKLLLELENAQTRAFKSDAAIAFIQTVKNFGTQIKINFFNNLANIRDGFSKLGFEIDKFGVLFKVEILAIPKFFKAAFDDSLRIVIAYVNQLIEYGKAIKSALSLDFTGAKAQIASIKDVNTEFTNTQKVLAEIEKDKAAALAKLISDNEIQKQALVEQAGLEAKTSAEKESAAEKAAAAEKEAAEKEAARIKAEQDALDAKNALSKEDVKIYLEQLEILKQQTEEYANNIEQLEKINELGLASEENQSKVNQQLDFYKDKLKEAEADILAMGFATVEVFDGTKALADELAEIMTSSSSADLGLAESFKNETISAQQFLDQLADNNETFQRDIIRATINTTQEIINNGQVTGDALLEQEQILADAKKKLKEQDLNDTIETAKKKVEAEKKANAETVENDEDEKEAKKQIAIAGLQIAGDIAGAIMDNQNTKFENELSEYRIKEEGKQAVDAELFAQGQITEAEFMQRKLVSEQAIANKEREIKRKKFEADRKGAIIQATIAGAVAIIQALPNAVLAGIVAATTAVQIGIIASQKVPKFKKGVKNFGGGMATVGDGGREIVRTPKGSFLAEKEMTTFLPKGSDVLTNRETEKYLQGNDSSLPYLSAINKSINKQRQSIVIVNKTISNSKLDYINARV